MTACRSCGCNHTISFLDMGIQPLPNQFLPFSRVDDYMKFPLQVMYCPECHLVQLEDLLNPEDVFNAEFKYFSSYSESLLRHSSEYVSMIIDRLELVEGSKIIEIASNDGYLLQFFLEEGFRNVMGVEPTKSTAEAAERKGIPTYMDFFTRETAKKLSQSGRADLIIANNVIAHVPDLNDFFSGLSLLLSDSGMLTVEFQSLEYLIENVAFDLVYHEHYSYLSLTSLTSILDRHDLKAVDVERLETQGGSLRVYICKKSRVIKVEDAVGLQLDSERKSGLCSRMTYDDFAGKVAESKKRCIEFFGKLKQSGASIAGYGAPAKGNVLLNGLGIDSSMIPFTVDRNEHKQNLVMAGCRIPVYPVERLNQEKPEYIVILPWNIRNEIMIQNEYVRSWKGKFVTLLPEIEIFE